ncbi:MAG: Membrane dipeptidase [Frondihabitans sp.]|nr:Membrane dipeptidase [Frondihabitans sp.]
MSALPVFDGHNDLPWALREGFQSDPASADLAAGEPTLHTDIPRLRAGGMTAQFWSVYVPSSLSPADAVVATLEEIDVVHRLVETYPEVFQLATTATDVRAARAAGLLASLLGMEGGHSIDSSLGVLRAMRRAGVAYLTLTHNDNTPWAASATGDPVDFGLTPFGEEVVREMNRIGMLVDLSHVAPQTMHDALDVSTAPVIFSHSSCRAVTDHVRNVPDDVLSRLSGNGGVVMLTFVPAFVSRTADGHATLDDVVAHVEHAREVAGVDHIGLGGDFDGTDSMPEGLPDVSAYPALFAVLAARGWSRGELLKLAFENTLRVLEAVAP